MVTVLLGLLVMVAWVLRDRPRLQLAKALGARLGATVTIGRLEIAASNRVRLHHVTIHHMASQPRLARLDVAHIEAEGNLKAVAEGRLRALHIDGGVLALQTPSDATVVSRDPPPTIDTATIRGLRVQLPDQPVGPAHHITINGSLTGMGSTTIVGNLQARVPQLATAPLMHFFGIETPNTPAAARLPGPSRIDLLLTTAGEQPRIEIDANLPHVRAAHAALQRSASGEWSLAETKLEGVLIAPWLAAVNGESGLRANGVLDLAIEGQTHRGLLWHANITDGAGEFDGLDRGWTLAGLRGSLSGVAHLEDEYEERAWHTSVEGQLDTDQVTIGPLKTGPLKTGLLKTADGTPTDVAIAIPARLLLEGRGRYGDTLRIEAVAALSLDDWGHFELDGVVDSHHLMINGLGDGALLPWLAGLASTYTPNVQLDRFEGRWHAEGRIEGPRSSPTVEATVGLDDLVLHDRLGRKLNARELDVRIGALVFFDQSSFDGPSTAIEPTRLEVTARDLVVALNDRHRLTAAEANIEASSIELRRNQLGLRARARARETLATWVNEHTTNHVHIDSWTADINLPAIDLSTGRAKTIDVAATLEGQQGELSGWHWTGDRAMTVAIGGSTAHPRLAVAPTALTLSPVLHGQVLEPIPFTLGGTAVVDTEHLRVDPIDVDIDAGPLGRGHLAGRFNPDALALHLDTVLEDLTPWLAHVPTLGELVPAGYTLSGGGQAQLNLHTTADTPWSLAGNITLSDGGLVSDDGSRVIQGLPIDAEITVTPTEATVVDTAGADTEDAAGITLDALAHIGGFQMLWGAVFADYGAHAAVAEIEARWQPAAGPALAGESERGSWQADVGLRFEGAASAGAPEGRLAIGTNTVNGLDYQFEVTSMDLDALLTHDVRTPLQGSVPWLDELEAAGRTKVELAGQWDAARRSARGSLTVSRGLVTFAGDRFRAEGLDLELPIDVTWQGGTPAVINGPPQKGRIRFDRLVAGGLGFEPVATELNIVADTVRFAGGLNGPFLGGRLGLGTLALVDLMRASRHISTAIELRAVDLGLAAQRLSLPPLEGRLDGAFPRVRATMDRFEVEGDGALNVFGGSVRIFDIAGSEVFSRYPRMTFSADFADIDLEQVTRTFDFGIMTGSVEGILRHCELFRGTPVRCAGRIESVPERHTKRFIDVKAVNNISILGTGGRIGRLDRGLHRFLRRFTYSSLGVDIALRDDRFQLRGLLSRNERELFLKGRLPFPIDIVNIEPGNTVSFQTMLGRLRNFEINLGQAP